MAYFLKRSKKKKGIYLQIYESFYNPEKKETSHKSIKALGYIPDLIKNGIDDPIEYFSNEVKNMNAIRNRETRQKTDRKISDKTPVLKLGYFPAHSIINNINISPYIDIVMSQYSIGKNPSEILSALIYARLIDPCSKLKTYNEVFDKLYSKPNCSLDHVYDALEAFGYEYQKIIELFNTAIKPIYEFDLSKNYYDGTNFYFEIDREDDFRKKGPSKERKTDPIVGMGLLLDANQIPIGMQMYPGNSSERPHMLRAAKEMKHRKKIKSKTIFVADKGLNSGNNIYQILRENNGYIFSKSVLQLPDIEIAWVMLKNDYIEVNDSRGKTLFYYKECVDNFNYTFTDENGKTRTEAITEKRVVTYNPSLAKKRIQEINRQVEKASNLSASQAKKSEYGDSSKYVIFEAIGKDGKADGKKIKSKLNEKLIEKHKQLAGFNLLVTSERKMKAIDIYETYHNLWRIEETFKIMKSDLDARPAYVQKKHSIIGHFLICYLSVLMIRLFQFVILENKWHSEAIIEFIQGFELIESGNGSYINATKSSEFIIDLSDMTGLPLDLAILKKREVKNIMEYRF